MSQAQHVVETLESLRRMVLAGATVVSMDRERNSFANDGRYTFSLVIESDEDVRQRAAILKERSL